jgi:hypothetical protein
MLRNLRLVFAGIFALASAAQAAPLVLYTDIVSGPNSGGENNKGIYLSVFGKNFGSTGLGSTTKVFIGGVEVDNYRTGLSPNQAVGANPALVTLTPLAAGAIGPSKGRPDVQQITVQVGALAGLAVDTPYPVTVQVNGVSSNADHTFTIHPGNIYFVNNQNGSDSSNNGSFLSPWRHVQTASSVNNGFAITGANLGGAFGPVRAGDFIVLRGHGTGIPWNDNSGSAGYDYFFNAQGKSGCPIGTNCAQGGGTSSGPITLMAYPGEDVFINKAYNASLYGGAIRSADSARQGLGYGAWYVISGLRLEGGGDEGMISVEDGISNPLGSHWRVVNNEMTGYTASANINAKSAGVAGNGPGSYWVGNFVHDVYCGPNDGTSPLQNHGFYIDADGDYEISYNRIINIFGGNGIQTYVNGTNGSNTTNNVSIHHNVIHDIVKHGINIGDNTVAGLKIWNNVVYNTVHSGLRFNTNTLVGAKIFNNTFFNTNTGLNNAYAVLSNDWNFPAGAADFRNNIFYASSGSQYQYGFDGVLTTFENNLWFNGQDVGSTSFDATAVKANPQFVSTTSGAEDLHLQAASPARDGGSAAVSALVLDDFDATTLRPQGAGYDIGAYEFGAGALKTPSPVRNARFK